MAAIVPTNVQRVSLGSATKVIATFSTVSDGDTWASGVAAILDKFCDMNGNPSTQASAGIASTFSAGTFTFYPGEDALPMRVSFTIE